MQNQHVWGLRLRFGTSVCLGAETERPAVFYWQHGGVFMFEVFNVSLCNCVTGPSDRQLWCHKMCLFQAQLKGSALSASHMERTMKLLRGRLQARLALHKQFSSLGTHAHINMTNWCLCFMQGCLHIKQKCVGVCFRAQHHSCVQRVSAFLPR